MSSRAEETAAALVAALGDYAFELDPLGMVVRFHGDLRRPPACPGGFIGRTVRETLPLEVAEVWCRTVQFVCHDGVPRTLEHAMPWEAGSRYVETRFARAPEGHVFVIVRDVHARRAAEEQLRESVARLRVMADAAPVMLWRAGNDGERDLFNEQWLGFTGRPLGREIGVGWAEGVHPEDYADCMGTYRSAFAARRSFHIEYRLRRHDGEYRWILDSGTPRFSSPGGAFEGYVGSCVDVTEQRDTHEQIRALFGELEERLWARDALLRETHHRVKNNLQLVSSLLSLDARQLDGDARRRLEEVRVRVRTIALIHEKLHGGKNLADVDLAEYARDLARMVLHASGAPAGIEVKVDGERVRVPVDQATPCGLVINELLTNALKHAFPDGRRGSVQIGVAGEPPGRVVVTVADDGVGLPAELDLRRPATAGLGVVMTLAEQLNAEVRVGSGPGASFQLSFPVRRDAA